MISRVDQTRFIEPFWDSISTIRVSWSCVISKIDVYNEFLKRFSEERPDDVREVQGYFFLLDVMNTEGIRVPSRSIDAFDDFLIELCSGNLSVAPNSDFEQKAARLYRAFHYVQNLPSSTPFDENLVKSIHMMVYDSETSGSYRTCHVEPTGSDLSNLYAHPYAISSRMRDLMTHVQKILSVYHTLPDRIRLSSWFLVEFLRIHPFLNANGRTGRLLMQFLMKETCLAPMGLCISSSKSRKCYLQAIERFDIYKTASDLATYTMHSILHTFQRLDYFLGFVLLQNASDDSTSGRSMEEENEQ